MSIFSAIRAKSPAAPATPPSPGCWVCTGGSGPMCASCGRRVRDTATREARVGYLASGGHS